jgi:hypothetical protein
MLSPLKLKKQAECLGLEAQLAREKLLSHGLTFEKGKFFFSKLKCGDVHDISCRRALVDTFVSKIYLFYNLYHLQLWGAEQNKMSPKRTQGLT